LINKRIELMRLLVRRPLARHLVVTYWREGGVLCFGKHRLCHFCLWGFLDVSKPFILLLNVDSILFRLFCRVLVFLFFRFGIYVVLFCFLFFVSSLIIGFIVCGWCLVKMLLFFFVRVYFTRTFRLLMQSSSFLRGLGVSCCSA